MCAIEDQKKISKKDRISPAVILKILKMLTNLFIPHSQSFRQGNSLILVEIRRCFPPGRRTGIIKNAEGGTRILNLLPRRDFESRAQKM